MNPRAEFLEWKRQQLLAESAAQRAELSAQIQSMAHTLGSVQTGLRIVDRFRKHPEWIAALALGLAAITPRRLSSFFRLGSFGLRAWRLVAPAVQMLTQHK